MPIRVECSRCHKVTYFADNDAGLAVACLACKTHLKVPIPAAAPKPVSPTVHPDEPPPLFSSTPKHLLIAPTPAKPAPAQLQQHHHSAKPRPVRPASPRSNWRIYSIIFGIILIAGLAIANKFYQDSKASSLAHDSNSTTQPASNPATTSPVALKSSAPATQPIAVAPPPVPSTPIIAHITPVSTPVANSNHYTPAGAARGLIGFDRIQIVGRTFIDSYSSNDGPYAKETAHANAMVMTNGPIQLAVDGEVRGAIHAASLPGRQTRNLTITGPTDPLPKPLNNPPVELDPLSNDSANSAIPPDYFKNGNFHVNGKHALSLPPGVYYVNDLIIDATATLELQGPTTFLISGQTIVIGSIETKENRPANCRIRVTTDKPVIITRNNTLYLDLYAPQSPIRIDGKGDLFGSFAGKTLTINGSRNFHLDEALMAR